MSERKRILLITGSTPDMVPYIHNYFKIVEKANIEYDVVCWNRRGAVRSFPSNYMVYESPTKDTYSSVRKIKEIYRFRKFALNKLRGRKYSTVVIFTIAIGMFFSDFLIQQYTNHYVFDIRDYSPMMNNWLLRHRVDKLLKNSAINVISSEGFRKWLPGGHEYVVCHNTDIMEEVASVEMSIEAPKRTSLEILTIGQLRDAEANCLLMKAMADHEDVHITFSGMGDALPELKNVVKREHISNVSFTGRYNKAEEDEIVSDCDMMNIMLNRNAVSDYLMSNRFYLSVRLRKPMIVNQGTYQAEIAEQFGLGIVLRDGDDVYCKVMDYWHTLNWERYNRDCNSFLAKVHSELHTWKLIVEQQIKKA